MSNDSEYHAKTGPQDRRPNRQVKRSEEVTASKAHKSQFVDLFPDIPRELKRRRQWCVSALEGRDGRPAKVPYRAASGNRRARTNDPSTWSSYEEAVAALGHGLDHVGFVFSADDPYVGIDLDDCRDPSTGRLEPWAKDIVDRLGSYTEVSASGTGLHIIVRCSAPLSWSKRAVEPGSRKAIEMYASLRFFIMTGKVLA